MPKSNNINTIKYTSKKRERLGRVKVENLDDEYWVGINGYEGLYEISNFGRIKRLSRMAIDYMGRDIFLVEKIMKESKTKEYPKVILSKNGDQFNKMIHVLLADAFIPNPLNLPYINHKNGIKHDYRLQNLERCTGSENVLHSINVLGNPMGVKGEKHYLSKLTNIQRMEVYDKYKSKNMSLKSICDEYNVSRATVLQIVHKLNYNSNYYDIKSATKNKSNLLSSTTKR